MERRRLQVRGGGARPLARLHALSAWVEALALLIAYGLLALASYRFTFTPNLQLAGSWLPSGLAVAWFILRPTRRWPFLTAGIFAAVVAVLGSRGLPLPVVLLWAVADCVEPLVTASLIHRALPTCGLPLLRAREVYLLAAHAGLSGPLASTVLAVAGAALGGPAVGEPLWRFALAWWGSAALGALSVAPLLLAAGRGRALQGGLRMGEALLLGGALLFLTAQGFILDQLLAQLVALGVAAFPLLAWAAIRFGPRGAAWGALAISLVAMVLSLRGEGPFFSEGEMPAHLRIVLIQAFFVFATLSALLIAALAAERRWAGAAQRLLADAGATLGTLEPIRHRLARAVELAAGAIGDAVVLWTDDPDVPAAVATGRNARLDQAEIAGLRLERSLAAATQRCDERGCWLVLPLHSGRPRRTFGTMAVRARRSRRYFDREEARPVAELAKCLILALEREALLAEKDRLYREAEEAVRIRDQFLSIASHELKTPLTPLAIRLQMLRRRVEAGMPVRTEAIDRVLMSLEKLTWLVNDLLDVARIQAGSLSIQRRSTSLTQVVEDALAELRPGDVERVQVAMPQEEILVEGDPQRLEQVVVNLLDNAIKYSRGEVGLVLQASGDEARLRVVDHGIGIPKEQLERLFGRYFRGRNASPASYGGLGLGLYIVRDIVERHGGRIWAESEEGRGSTFHVALPLLQVRPRRSDPHPLQDAEPSATA